MKKNLRKMNKINRRNFIKKTSLSGAAIATASALSSSKYKERDKVKKVIEGIGTDQILSNCDCKCLGI